jgi:hypothetical protein
MRSSGLIGIRLCALHIVAFIQDNSDPDGPTEADAAATLQHEAASADCSHQCVCVCVCVCVRIYIYIYIYVCIHIYMYI